MFLGIPRKRVGISVDPPLPRLDVLDHSQGLDQIVLGGARLLVKGMRITDANIQRDLIMRRRRHGGRAETPLP